MLQKKILEWILKHDNLEPKQTAGRTFTQWIGFEKRKNTHINSNETKATTMVIEK